jgi:hypothetical protein
MLRYPYIALCLIAITGCTVTTPKTTYYVSPVEYEGYSCQQIKDEMSRISFKRDQAIERNNGNQVLDTALKAFVIYNGGSYSDDNREIEGLNNTYDALDRLFVKKGCTSA